MEDASTSAETVLAARRMPSWRASVQNATTSASGLIGTVALRTVATHETRSGPRAGDAGPVSGRNGWRAGGRVGAAAGGGAGSCLELLGWMGYCRRGVVALGRAEGMSDRGRGGVPNCKVVPAALGFVVARRGDP